MSRTVHEIADDLATAQLFVEAAEEERGAASRALSDAGFKLSDATTMRDRLRLELRAALREAGDVWGNPGVELPPVQVAEWHRDATIDDNGNPRVYRDPVKP